MKLLIKTTLLFAVFCFSLSGQISKGDQYFANFNYHDAVKAYKYALKKDSVKTTHIYQRLADSYRLLADYENAEIWYAKVVKAPNVQPVNYFHYGRMLMSNKKYAEAREWFLKYAEKLPADSRAQHYSQYSTEKIIEILTDKGNFQIAGVSVNSEYDDFSPVYFGNKIIFASNRPDDLLVSRKHSWNDMPFVDLYVADAQDDNDLIDANRFHQFNEDWHEGPVSFTSDLKRIYFTRNASRSSKLLRGINSTTNLMIYTARKVTLADGDEKWTTPEAIDFNSVEYTCQHPSISHDGEKLYFASDQPGGMGGMDIYVAERTILGWSKPRNLGPIINTSGDEAFPFISNKGDLYFSSKGHIGAGGFDNFVARGKGSGFEKPVNLGSPVNDISDDFGFILHENGEEGYFSSNRKGGAGRDDIYRFKVLGKIETKDEEEVDEIQVDSAAADIVTETDKSTTLPNTDKNQMTVFVFDKLSGEGLKQAVVNIFNENGKLKGAVQVNEKGFATLERNEYSGKLRFISSYPEYISYREIVDVDNLPLSNARINLPLSKDLGKITSLQGKDISINPIYFDYDKDNIRPDAAKELDKIVVIMKDNPNMIIEVASHTDSRGNNTYNMNLSDRRARSSRQYIINNGIAEERVKGKGYGEVQLTNECEDGVACPESKHQLNRRTEFQIIRF